MIWEKKYSPSNDAKWLSDSHDHILVYAKDKNIWRPNMLPRTAEMNARYKNPDNDPRGVWKSGDVLVKSFSPSGVFPIVNPNTNVSHFPPKGSCYRFSEESAKRYLAENRFYFGKDGKGGPQLKRFLTEVQDGTVTKTIWFRTEVGDNQDAKKEVKAFNAESIFATPKPEKLIERIIRLATDEGDLVLDSFLGSGTTAAVAHKMKRNYIGIELGEQAKTHCYPRLKAVIDGEQGGISEMLNWTGGGGFKFYNLAPSLLKLDKFGNWVISEEYNSEMLAAAMAKQEGFSYLPNESVFWKQGFSTENDYIFTTTQFLTVENLEAIHDEMAESENLLVCCKAFQKECSAKYTNVTIKKIPQILLDRCEFGKQDYNLNIIDLPQQEECEPECECDCADVEDEENGKVDNQGSLFDSE